MIRIPQKYKFLLFAALALGGLIYLARSANTTPNPAWYQSAAHRLLTPVALGISRGLSSFQSLSQEYLQLRGVKQDSLALKSELAQLRAQLLRLQEENRGLSAEQRLFSESGMYRDQGRAARVIGYDPIPAFRSITIDQGSEQGIAPDQVVVAGGGVIGRVLKAGSRSSQVLLVTDLNSAVDVIDARTRARGLLVGKRRDMGLKRERWLTQAEYVSASEEIKSGDLLLTSGLDGIFPKGLPVGVVGEVKKDHSGLFWQAEVEPYAELNKLEEVLVLAPKPGSEG